MEQLRDPYTGQFVARTYKVTVWNMTNGDTEKYVHEATQAEVDEIEDFYADEPLYEVEVELND